MDPRKTSGSTVKRIFLTIKGRLFTKRFLIFSTVGISGLVVNLFFAWLFHDLLGIKGILSSSLAIELSIVNNFTLNYLWTWQDRRRGNIFKRAIKYHLGVGAGAMINIFFVIILYRFLGLPYLPVHLTGILFGAAFNFLISDLWVFGDAKIPLNRWDLAFLIFLLAVTSAQIFFASRVELFFDEAYYWTWAKHLALGYLDHPPFIAWMIYPFSNLPKEELFLRIPSIIFSFFSTILVYLFVYDYSRDKEFAFIGVLIFRSFLLVNIIGFIVVPDAPFMFFWILSFYLLQKALKGKKIAWYLFGLSFGFALLSKYLALFIPIIGIILLLSTDKYRIWFRRKEPYLAGILALLVFSPVLYWNLMHQLISFKFQLLHGVEGGGRPVTNLMNFMSAPFLILSPPAAIKTLIGFSLALKRNHRFLLIAIGLPLTVLMLLSLKSNPSVHWLLCGFLLFPLMAKELWQRRRIITAILILLSFFTTGTAFMASINNRLYSYLEALSGEYTYCIQFKGWKDLAKEVERINNNNLPILCCDYHIASELSFYLGRRSLIGVYYPQERVSQFSFWVDLSSLRGNVLYVTTEKKGFPIAMERNLMPLAKERIIIDDVSTVFWVYHCRIISPLEEEMVIQWR